MPMLGFYLLWQVEGVTLTHRLAKSGGKDSPRTRVPGPRGIVMVEPVSRK